MSGDIPVQRTLSAPGARGEFASVQLADGTAWALLSRLADGRVMCCLCFRYCARAELTPCGDGVEDVCRECSAREGEFGGRPG